MSPKCMMINLMEVDLEIGGINYLQLFTIGGLTLIPQFLTL
jgi:hypothetical protein